MIDFLIDVLFTSSPVWVGLSLGILVAAGAWFLLPVTIDRKHKINKVWIDYDECLAHHLCVLQAPNIFEERNDELYPQTKPDISKLTSKETKNIFLAAAICPVSAIKLELESGEILDGDSEFIIKFEKNTRPKNA